MKNQNSQDWPRAVPEESFRLRLQTELGRRCADNPRYSLRAFAAWLDVDHSTLSQLLRGRRKLTEQTIRRLGKRLAIDEVLLARYVAAQEILDRSPDPASEQLELMAEDAQALCTEWEHAALLELTRIESFRADSRWVGQVLGISTDRANLVLQRLVRLELLRMNPDGRWVDCSEDSSLPGPASAAQLRAVAESTHRMALEALERTHVADQEHTSATLAVDSARLPEVRAALARMQHELAEISSADQQRNEVYRLDIRFFPLTKTPPEQDPDA